MDPVIVFDTSLFSLALHFGVGPFYVSTTDLFCGANAAIRWGLRLRLVTWGTGSIFKMLAQSDGVVKI